MSDDFLYPFIFYLGKWSFDSSFIKQSDFGLLFFQSPSPFLLSLVFLFQRLLPKPQPNQLSFFLVFYELLVAGFGRSDYIGFPLSEIVLKHPSVSRILPSLPQLYFEVGSTSSSYERTPEWRSLFPRLCWLLPAFSFGKLVHRARVSVALWNRLSWNRRLFGPLKFPNSLKTETKMDSNSPIKWIGMESEGSRLGARSFKGY